jgi:uncharacterized protein (TIGR04255 family)
MQETNTIVASKHPKYPNPIIQEALCEIHFSLPEGQKWRSSVFGELFKRIQDEYPTLEPVMQLGLQFQFGPGKLGQSLLPPRQRMRYKHKSQNTLIQLSENIFTYNVLPRYNGWDVMKEGILKAWADTMSIIKVDKITRIGLRYINRINLAQNQKPSHWLSTSSFIPQAAIDSMPGFLSRIEVQAENNRRTIVTLGDSLAQPEHDHPILLFDIDCIVEKAIVNDAAAIEKEIHFLHEFVWNVFESSKTKNLENYMKANG